MGVLSTQYTFVTGARGFGRAIQLFSGSGGYIYDTC